jgi:hypothetical protein
MEWEQVFRHTWAYTGVAVVVCLGYVLGKTVAARNASKTVHSSPLAVVLIVFGWLAVAVVLLGTLATALEREPLNERLLSLYVVSACAGLLGIEHANKGKGA